MQENQVEQKNAAQFLVECLEQEKVEYVFGIPGEENLEVVKALQNSRIQFIITRHEQGAAFMADVYGRLTGNAGVCLSTLGPGATNLVTGVADAQSDGAPMIAITGQVGTDKMHLTSHQYLDLVKMFEPITKRSKQIVRPESVNEIVRIAFKYAESEKPGACHIDLPVNVARKPVSPAEKPLHKQENPKEMAEFQEIEEAASLIFQAKNPVILAGSGAVRNHTSKALTAFAEHLKIPVINTMMAKGIIPFDNPYAMWTIGIPQKDYVNKIIESADMVIAVGYDLVEYAPAKWNAQNRFEIIHIDTRPAHINKLYQPSVEVVGDISESLDNIRRRCSRTAQPEYIFSIKKQMVEADNRHESDTAFPMKPQKILCDVRKVMGAGDIVLSDVGAHKMWIAREYHCYEPNTCIISNGFASMGIALPGAITAKLVSPDKRVLAITGDGGFLMNVQELETAKRLKLAFVTLIFHDDSYGLIKWKEMDQYGESFCVDFSNPDFVKLAESFGLKGYRVTKAQELIPVLEEAFSQKEPTIIDCPVDYNENSKLTETLKAMFGNE